MNDQHPPTPIGTSPVDRFNRPAADPFPEAGGAPARPGGATFSGRTPRRTAAIRAGVVVGTGLLVVIGAAVAMGASPSASPSSGGQPRTQPGPGGANGNGHGFGPFGHLLPGGPDGGAFPGGGPGWKDGRGLGRVSVTKISGDSVSLATEDGWTRTITVTGTTKITKGGVAATLADLAVGDVIRFGQTRNGDGTWTITAIDIVQPQVAGTVTAVGSDTITIALRDGTSRTIRTNGSTAYHLERSDATRADVTVGAAILATGEKASDGSLAASSVWVRLPHVVGTVTGTTTDTITLSRRDGTSVTIHVGAGTAIRVAGVDSATLSDIKTGMVVVVEGTQRADGSLDARAIGAGDRGKGKGLGHDRQPGLAPDASPAPAASSGSEG
jgi:hypothetical protein